MADETVVPAGLTVQDILNIINTHAAATATAKTESAWQPNAASIVDRNQQAYEDAPEWKAGATYWKPGSKPANVP